MEEIKKDETGFAEEASRRGPSCYTVMRNKSALPQTGHTDLSL